MASSLKTDVISIMADLGLDFDGLREEDGRLIVHDHKQGNHLLNHMALLSTCYSRDIRLESVDLGSSVTWIFWRKGER